MNKVDLIIKSVQITLEPHTINGTIILGIEAGIVRPDNLPEKGFINAALHIKFVFERGYLFAIKLVQATLHGVGGMTPEFADAANRLVDKIIENDKATTFELFQFNDKIASEKKNRETFIPFIPKVIDNNTAGLFFGDGDFSQISRNITSGNSFSLAVQADYVKEHILCRSLLNKEDLDSEWKEGEPPTETEREKLPAPCGSGALSKSSDGADVKIKELNFIFRDGFLDINGIFDAEGFCWEVNDGNFSQKATLNFIAATDKTNAQILPSFDPPVPHVNYDVDIDFLCDVLGFVPD